VRSSLLNALYQFKFFLLDSAMTVGFLVQRFPRGPLSDSRIEGALLIICRRGVNRSGGKWLESAG
jgi:hypothetical protein